MLRAIKNLYQALLYTSVAKSCPEWINWKISYTYSYGIKLGFHVYKRVLILARCWWGFLPVQGGLHNSSTLMQEPKHTAFPTTKLLNSAMSIPAPEGSCCSSLWRWLSQSTERTVQHCV